MLTMGLILGVPTLLAVLAVGYAFMQDKYSKPRY